MQCPEVVVFLHYPVNRSGKPSALAMSDAVSAVSVAASALSSATDRSSFPTSLPIEGNLTKLSPPLASKPRKPASTGSKRALYMVSFFIET